MATNSFQDPKQAVQYSFDGPSKSFRVNQGLTVVSTFGVAAASINGSGGAVYQLTASTPYDISKLVPNDGTATSISLYTGAPGSEVLLLIMAPGQTNAIDMFIPANTRLTIRATGVTAPSTGSIYLAFIG